LRVESGYFLVGIGRKKWKRRVSAIPNFIVFWMMAQELYAQRAGQGPT
jgi:hypothetical protein